MNREEKKYTRLEEITVGGLRINFQRTCRVPEGKLNSLPAGLGSFPIYRVVDFSETAPKEWRRSGYFIPMYAQEALWINFRGRFQQEPKALIVGAGNINAITGKLFFNGKKKGKKKKEDLEIKLESNPQNYLTVPPQPWLDGWKDTDDKIYQFVAAELGSGQTVEGQITGEEKVGGLQFIVYSAKPGTNLIPESTPHEYIESGGFFSTLGYSHPRYKSVCFGGIAEEFQSHSVKHLVAPASVRSMGLGRGGEIRQKVYTDKHGIDVWNEKPTAIEMVYIVSSEDFEKITGFPAPPTPVSYEAYQKQKLPWFELPDEKYEDAKGSDIFEKLKPVSDGKIKPKKQIKSKKKGK